MQNTPSLYKCWSWTLVLGLAIGAWDTIGLDLPSAQWFGNAQGFALRDNYWLTVILHDGARKAGWMVLIALAAVLWRPWGPFRALQRLSTPQRWGLWLSIVGVAIAFPPDMPLPALPSWQAVYGCYLINAAGPDCGGSSPA